MKLLSRSNLALVFGGRSSEHDISCLSAYNVARLIDRERWHIIPVGITREGHWLLADSIEDIAAGSWRDSEVSAEITPDALLKSIVITWPGGKTERLPVDIIFPVLHGLYGEDGTVQGLFELSGIPYVGCGVLASAAGMDKFYTKIIVDSIGVRQARFIGLRRGELDDAAALGARLSEIGAALGFPLFVKPSRAGSSVGVSKAYDEEGLRAAVMKAAEYDSKILVEEYIEGRELECAVFKSGSDPALASGVGEIIAAADFYDFEAKYHSAESITDVDPVLSPDIVGAIRENAVRIFDALSGYGLARVDFFLKDSGELIFNEINTLPGFTSVSMYPMLWEKQGVNKKELIEKLLISALRRDEI